MILYSTESCAPCKSLKHHLDSKGIEYRVLDADQEPHTTTLIKLTGMKLVPTLVTEDHGYAQGLQSCYAFVRKISQ